jgi:hypothetical protein
MPTTCLPRSSPSTSWATLLKATSAARPPAPSIIYKASASPPTRMKAHIALTLTVQDCLPPRVPRPSSQLAQTHTLTPRTMPPPHGAARPGRTTTLFSAHDCTAARTAIWLRRLGNEIDDEPDYNIHLIDLQRRFLERDRFLDFCSRAHAQDL